MSAISTKIYGNDMAMDVKEDFLQLYGIKKSIEEIHQYIFAYQPNDLSEDACAYWSALAFIEWEYGVLDDYVKNQAIYIIEHNSDSHLFINKEDQVKRKKDLDELIIKLNTSNVKSKKRKTTFIYHCPYKRGDVLALPLNNKYVYLHIVGVLREKKKITELEEDKLYIRVFDVLSDELLSIEKFKPKWFFKSQYVNLDKYEKCCTQQLWCLGIREKEKLEKKLIFIGNVSVKEESTNSVSIYFEFKKVEETLIELFKI